MVNRKVTAGSGTLAFVNVAKHRESWYWAGIVNTVSKHDIFESWIT